MTKRTADLIQRIVALGFTTEEAWQLRRIERTLHRWAEAECGDSNDWASWSIERAEPVELKLVNWPNESGNVWLVESRPGGLSPIQEFKTRDKADKDAVRAHRRQQDKANRQAGKPFRVTHPHKAGSKVRREAIPDREKGALKRLDRIVAARNERWFAPNTEANRISEMPGFVLSYHQTDPRGCALYLLRASDVRPGEKLDSIYSRGLAVCD